MELKILLHIDNYVNKLNRRIHIELTSKEVVNGITSIISLSDTDHITINKVVNNFIVLLIQLSDYRLEYSQVKELYSIVNPMIESIIVRFLENKVLIVKRGLVGIYRNPLIDFKGFYLKRNKKSLFIFNCPKMDIPLLPEKA